MTESCIRTSLGNVGQNVSRETFTYFFINRTTLVGSLVKGVEIVSTSGRETFCLTNT